MDNNIRMNLKEIILRIACIWFKQGTVAGFCEHDNEHLVSIQDQEFYDQMNDCQFIKRLCCMELVHSGCFMNDLLVLKYLLAIIDACYRGYTGNNSSRLLQADEQIDCGQTADLRTTQRSVTFKAVLFTHLYIKLTEYLTTFRSTSIRYVLPKKVVADLLLKM